MRAILTPRQFEAASTGHPTQSAQHGCAIDAVRDADGERKDSTDSFQRNGTPDGVDVKSSERRTRNSCSRGVRHRVMTAGLVRSGGRMAAFLWEPVSVLVP